MCLNPDSEACCRARRLLRGRAASPSPLALKVLDFPLALALRRAAAGRPEIILPADQQRRQRIDRRHDHAEPVIGRSHRFDAAQRIGHRPAADAHGGQQRAGIGDFVGELVVDHAGGLPVKCSCFVLKVGSGCQ
jgi:hypothetical protein